MLFPRIWEDGSINDFAPTANYSVKVTVRLAKGDIRVENKIEGSEVLSDLIESGELQWNAEFRIPHAIHSKTHFGNSSEDIFLPWESEHELTTCYVISGLYAVEDTRIDKKHLTNAWKSVSGISHFIDIPKGAQIARSNINRVSGGLSEFITFKQDDQNGTHLSGKKGQIKVVPKGTDPVAFIAIISDDIWETRNKDRSMCVAALAEALRQVTETSSWDDPNESILVKEHLIELGLENDWKEDFQPLYWASVWERLHPVRAWEEE